MFFITYYVSSKKIEMKFYLTQYFQVHIILILDLQYLVKINNLYCKQSYCAFEWVYQHITVLIWYTYPPVHIQFKLDQITGLKLSLQALRQFFADAEKCNCYSCRKRIVSSQNQIFYFPFHMPLTPSLFSFYSEIFKKAFKMFPIIHTN